MSRRRFFVDEIRDSHAELSGEEARHLTRVLRVHAGQQFEVSDNTSLYLAEIVEAARDKVRFRVVASLPEPPAPPPITLVAALIKFDRFEWMIEKATELGVTTILPVESARTDEGLFEAARKRRERWLRIARESSQQSRRVRMPEIAPAVRFREAVNAVSASRFWLEEIPGAPSLLRALASAPEPVALAVGPEGGWKDEERQLFERAGWAPVSLAPSILRAETAAIAAIAVAITSWAAGE